MAGLIKLNSAIIILIICVFHGSGCTNACECGKIIILDQSNELKLIGFLLIWSLQECVCKQKLAYVFISSVLDVGLKSSQVTWSIGFFVKNSSTVDPLFTQLNHREERPPAKCLLNPQKLISTLSCHVPWNFP